MIYFYNLFVNFLHVLYVKVFNVGTEIFQVLFIYVCIYLCFVLR